MAWPRNYQLALLQLAHLLFSADDSLDEAEMRALNELRAREGIGEDVFHEFRTGIVGRTEKEIYDHGIELIDRCTDQEKLRAFAHLYHLSDIDGRVHVKEVRLLLYSIKVAGLDFGEVVKLSAQLWPK
jgi:hypothetical protein